MKTSGRIAGYAVKTDTTDQRFYPDVPLEGNVSCPRKGIISLRFTQPLLIFLPLSHSPTQP
jgi:hypothetical protein